MPTSITAFVGAAATGPRDRPIQITRFAEFERLFGGLHLTSPMSYAVRDYFANGGQTALVVRVKGAESVDGARVHERDVIGDETAQTGIYALNRAEHFNLLCLPPLFRDTGSMPCAYVATSAAVYQAALALCVSRRAMLIVDPDPAWAVQTGHATQRAIRGRHALGFSTTDARNATMYFPAVRQADPLRRGDVDTFVPCGMIAGVYARTDARRGVWKAPAGLDATLGSVHELQVDLSDEQHSELNALGINCLRSMGARGHVVWGARTLASAENGANEFTYLSVRRLALFLEESIARGTQWAVFEPNDEPLWAQLRTTVEAFLHGLFRQGAMQGTTPREAYYVKCDRDTMTAHEIARGIVNIVVGFAALRPAEFVVCTIQQRAASSTP